MDFIEIAKKNGLEYYILSEFKIVQVIRINTQCCAIIPICCITDYLQDQNVKKEKLQSTEDYIIGNFDSWYRYFEYKFAWQENYYLTKNISDTEEMSESDENNFLHFIGKLTYKKKVKEGKNLCN